MPRPLLGTLRNMGAIFVAAHIAAAVASATSLSCTDFTNATIVIADAGQYDVTCGGDAAAASWYVHIVGCDLGSNSGPSIGVVSVRLLASPTQVIVSDNASLVGRAATTSLSRCSVDVTFTANTTVPPAGATRPQQAHVYVSTAASSLRRLAVLLLAAVHLEGGVVAVDGGGGTAEAMELVNVTVGMGSSVLCRRSISSSICSVTLGTSILRLASGCPPSASLAVTLRGTNVTESLWEPIGDAMGGSYVPGSTFALVAVDDYNVSLRGTQQMIVLDSVQGVVVGINRLLTARQLKTGVVTDFVYSDYPHFNGTVAVLNCTLLGGDGGMPFVFDFSSIVSATLVMSDVVASDGVFSVAFPAAQAGAPIATPCGATPVCVQLRRCHISATATLVKISGSAAVFPLVGIHIADSNATITWATTFIIILHFAAGLDNQCVATLNLRIQHSCFQLMSNAARLLWVYSTTVETNGAPPPTLTHSSITFTDVQVYQRWEYFSAAAEVPVAPLLQVWDAHDSTILFMACNITVGQVSPSHTASLPATLLAVSGSLSNSLVTFRNTIIQMIPIGSGAQVLRPSILTFGYLNTSLFLFVGCTFTNALAVIQLTQSSESPLNVNTNVTIGCNSWWCTGLAAAHPVHAPAVCSLLTSTTLINDTDVPRWMTVTSMASTCTDEAPSWSSTAASSRSRTFPTTSLQPSVATSLMTATVLPTPRSATTTQSHTRSHPTASSTFELLRSLSSTVWMMPALGAATPEVPPIAQVVVVAAIAPMAGAVLATSVAGVVQRSTVALRFSNCAALEEEQHGRPPPPDDDAMAPRRGQSMAVAESPTRLAFGDAEGAMYRGAAVGNVVILAAVCALVAPIGYTHARFGKKSSSVTSGNRLGRALAALRLPGRAFVVLAVLLQPTVTAAAGLLMLGPVSTGDAVLAVAALSVLVALIAWPAWAVRRGCSTLVTAMHSPATGGALDYAAGRRVVWVPRHTLPTPGGKSSAAVKPSWLLEASVTGAECFAQQFDPLMGRMAAGVARELFFVTGCLWSAVTGVVGALNPDDLTSCRTAQATLVGVAALSLASIVMVRPFASPFDRNLNVVMELLSLLVAVMSLADVSGGAEGITYAQIGLSAVASLLRVAARIQLNVSLPGTFHIADAGACPTTAATAAECVDPYSPATAAGCFIRSDAHAHLDALGRQPTSATRRARVLDIAHRVISDQRYGLDTCCRTSTPDCVHEMLAAVHRHRRLEAAMGHTPSFALPPRMRQQHLVKIIILASKASESDSCFGSNE